MSPLPNERRPDPQDPASTGTDDKCQSARQPSTGAGPNPDSRETPDSLASQASPDHLDDPEKTSDSLPNDPATDGKAPPPDVETATDSEIPQLSEVTFARPNTHQSRPTQNPLDATLVSKESQVKRDYFEIDVVDANTNIPNSIGRYRVRRLLGEGAFGKVYEAHDPQLERRVAIKVAKEISGDTQIRRFLREARAAAQLRHPNIIPVYEYGIVDGQNIIVYEFVAGTTLKSFLKRRSCLGLPEAIEIIRLIAEGLDYAHSQGIIHRDMKPDNVLIDKSGIPHIADFGCARTVNDQTNLTIDGSILGTPTYMSPEQASGNSNLADGRTDIWSLGVMLYEMVAGTRPFHGKLTDLLYSICHDDAQPLRKAKPSTPIDIETICSRCLSREPDKRFLTAGLLAAELERFQRGEPILSRPIGPLRRTWLWAKRNQMVASLLATVAVILLLASIVSSAFAIEAYRERRNRAITQLNALKTSEASALPGIFEDLAPFRHTVLPRLREQLAMEDVDRDARHRIRMAILELDEDPARRQQLAEEMVDDLLTSDAGDFFVCRSCLRFHQSNLTEKLWNVALDSTSSNSGARRFRAAAALALYDPGSPNWDTVAGDVVGYLTALNQIEMSHWLSSLQPVREILKPNLVKAYFDRQNEIDNTPVKTAAIISRMFTDQVEFLAELIAAATPQQIPYLTGALKINSTDAIPQLQKKLDGLASAAYGNARETSNLIISLIQLQDPNQWNQLTIGSDPSAVTNLIERLGPSSTPAELLVDQVEQWQSLDPDILSGVLLSLGQFRPNQILRSQRARFLPILLDIFGEHESAHVHSSARWLLGEWEFDEERKRQENQLRRAAPEPGKNWHVDLAGNTFAIFGPVESFEMGLDKNWTTEPDFDVSRMYSETLHRKQIPRRFGICIHEVTIEQFEEFESALTQHLNNKISKLKQQLAKSQSRKPVTDGQSTTQTLPPDELRALTRNTRRLELRVKDIERVRDRRANVDKSLPIGDVDFWSSLAYCRWLSETQGTESGIPSLDNLQTIYEKGTDYEFTQTRLALNGYRLPTSTEWEYACRGRSKTLFPFGRSSQHADRYAWFATNSEAKLHPVCQLKPGPNGIFDMLGNVSEWCLDWHKEQLPTLDNDQDREFYIDHGPEFAASRTLEREYRGGSFLDEVKDLRATRRRGTRPIQGFPRLGFRLGRTY